MYYPIVPLPFDYKRVKLLYIGLILFAAAIEAIQADKIYHIEELALIETLQGILGISAEEVILDLTVLERIASTKREK